MGRRFSEKRDGFRIQYPKNLVSVGPSLDVSNGTGLVEPLVSAQSVPSHTPLPILDRLPVAREMSAYVTPWRGKGGRFLAVPSYSVNLQDHFLLFGGVAEGRSK